jgi:hypothetical protein
VMQFSTCDYFNLFLLEEGPMDNLLYNMPPQEKGE